MTDEDFDSWDDLLYAFESDFYVPSTFLLDPQMKVVSADAGLRDPGPLIE